jgi:hypothetical protein
MNGRTIVMDKNVRQGKKVVRELKRRGVQAQLATRGGYKHLPKGTNAVVLPGRYLGNGVTGALSEGRRTNPRMHIIAHFGLDASETAALVVSKLAA